MDGERVMEDALTKLEFVQFQQVVKKRYERTGMLTRGERRAINRQITDLLDQYIVANGEPRAWETVLV